MHKGTIVQSIPTLSASVLKLYHCLRQGSFLSEGHIHYYTLVRGPDFVHHVIVLGKVAFHQITNF